MIDIKLRNVKVEDGAEAVRRVGQFMSHYADRRGISNGVRYAGVGCNFYVYRTKKTVICFGDYGVVDK